MISTKAPPSSYNLPLLVASDHAGVDLKQRLKALRKGLNWRDLGSHSSEQRTDYPDWAEKLCLILQKNLLGVLICGTGQGMSIKANRFPHVRASLCWSVPIARLAREHNKANVLCLPGRFLKPEQALKILDVFLSTEFKGSKVYRQRLQKL